LGVFKGNTDLLIKIKEVKSLLNGVTPDGKEATYASLFKIWRYAIILLVSINFPGFEEHTKQIQSTTYINFYRLNKIAKFLDLKFDRTKMAYKIYTELESKGLTRTITDDNKTFITVTEKGQEKCLEKLDQLLKLNEYLYSDASLKDRYSEEEQRLDENRMSKDLKIKPSHPTEKEVTVDNLIKRISDLGAEKEDWKKKWEEEMKRKRRQEEELEVADLLGEVWFDQFRGK
jgi:predicted transcriptional regulator